MAATKHEKLDELLLANKLLLSQLEEKEKRIDELMAANKELLYLKNEQQPFFSAIVESSSDAIVSKNLEGIISSWNLGAEKIFGYKKDEVIGKHITILIPPHLHSEETVIIEKIKNGITINHYVTQRIKKDGMIFYASLTISPIKDHSGSIIGASKILRDISEQKAAEAEVILAKIRQEGIINGTEDLIWSIDTDLNLVTANSAYLEMMKIAKHGPVILGDSVIIPEFGEELAARWTNYYRKALNGERYRVKEEIYNPIKEKKEYAHISFNPMRNLDGEIFGVACFSKNITDETESLIKLEDAKAKLERIMESSLDAICAVDANGVFVQVSAASEKIWGYKPDEMIGRSVSDFVYPEDREKTEQSSKSVMAGNNVIGFENRYVRKDGTLVALEWSVSWDENSRTRYGVARDVTERKNTEREISLLINNTEEAFILVDEDLKITSFNNQFYNLYKIYVGREIKKGESILKYALGENIEALKTKYKSVLAGNIDYSELEFPVLNNESKIFSIKYSPAKDYSNDIIGVFVTVSDVTEKRKFERQREFEQRDKEALINSIDDLLWSVTPDFKLIAANHAFIKNVSEVTGLTIKPGDELVLKDVFPPEVLTFWTRLYKKALSGKSFRTEIAPRRDPGNTSIWYELGFNPIFSDGKIIGTACYSRNITERKAAEEKIRQSEAFLAEAQRLARMGSWNFNFIEDKLTWSDELYQVFGASQDTFLETHGSFVSLVDESDRKLVLETSRRTRQTGEPFKIEYGITTAAGEKRIIQEHGYGEKDKRGRVIRLFGTAQDITERKLAEQRLEQQRKELILSNMELEQFAFVISHDLQEPLRMVTSFLSRIEARYSELLDDKGKLYINYAVDGARRMRHIILDLLEFSRLSRKEDHREPVDLNDLVKEVKILLSKKIRDKNATIYTDLLPSVHSNRVQMLRVFQNLVSNALKYAKKDVNPEIRISVEEEKGQWKFSVTDNGIGIEREYFEKVFVIFQRLHSRDEYSGTGIGLAIVKKIIENDGGKVWLESEEGKGSTFYFTILKK